MTDQLEIKLDVHGIHLQEVSALVVDYLYLNKIVIGNRVALIQSNAY